MADIMLRIIEYNQNYITGVQQVHIHSDPCYSYEIVVNGIHRQSPHRAPTPKYPDYQCA